MLYVEDLIELSSSTSSAGVLTKWMDPRNNTYIKTSAFNNETKTYHVEAVMECLTSDIGRLIGVSVVDYWLDELKIADAKVLVCVSEDYKIKTPYRDKISVTSFLVSRGMEGAVRSDRYRNLVAEFPEIRESLDRLIVFDYLIDNYDRHMRNVELLSLEDGSVRLAPLFDNGSSLLADWVTQQDLADLEESEELFEEHIINAETQSKCFAHDSRAELMLVDKSVFRSINLSITDEEWEKVTRKYAQYLSPLRLKMIYRLLTTRYSNLLHFASISYK
ncbi:HipA domain-containing protein [Paenibacillus jiagnxiensis]|uniref:HipA domain-containing protein n=1 Tax=Paenibacillus jiagnxiensis TaxID=3228926 RepID=UPI0033AD389A